MICVGYIVAEGSDNEIMGFHDVQDLNQMTRFQILSFQRSIDAVTDGINYSKQSKDFESMVVDTLDCKG